jgi:hypothetical protein
MALMDTDELYMESFIRKVWVSIPTLTKYQNLPRGRFGGILQTSGTESHHRALKSLGVLNNKHIPEVSKFKRCSTQKYSLVSSIQMDT